jgi:hypothetical protein
MMGKKEAPSFFLSLDETVGSFNRFIQPIIVPFNPISAASRNRAPLHQRCPKNVIKEYS